MWSDNAGWYKSTLTMALLHQELGDKIKVYHFCEAQDGKGKFIPWNNIGSNRIATVQFIIQDDWTDVAFTPLNSEVVSNGDEDEGEENSDTDEPIPKKRKVPQRVFQCPEEGCTRLFRFSSSLDQHLLLGNCDLREEKLGLKDKSMVMYAKKLDTGSLGKSYTKQLESSKVGVPPLKCGWALKVKKPKIPFTDDQKAFMQEKFLIGKTSGRKEDPLKVAEEMRYSVRNGTKRFSKEQYLTSQQIASYFSRMVQKDKKMDQDDLIAANANSTSFVLKQDVLKEIAI
ncbi:uncharacterized protein LOC125654201 [Ostrea edulis]|uniref:uncharacterized protein LOC125654201 n=1 Tax=Ostrea edulis TaxID=37623 RepID=UPI0024AFB07D|nr:uncharacterized protein LOC125654201 [Ostrea edulis]